MVKIADHAITRRWRELRADLAWIAGSWLRPGDAEARWQQKG